MDILPQLAGGEADAFRQSVLHGLSRSPKFIEPRWLYDGVGAKLFEAITKLDHYYPTRIERAIIKGYAAEMADALGDGVTIVEPGSGEALKVRPILEALGPRARGYVPIDIAADQLEAVAGEMAARYPRLTVRGVAADFFGDFEMPQVERGVVFFPGSTIGNMPEERGAAFLTNMLDRSGAERLLVGFDLVKDRRVMIDAYNDPAGVTRAFKMNLLQRMNRELAADFDLNLFRFEAGFNEDTSAIEMFVVSEIDQTVTVAGTPIAFAKDESISSEDSRKYTLESFAEFAAKAGLTPVSHWTDPRDYFCVMLLTRS